MEKCDCSVNVIEVVRTQVFSILDQCNEKLTPEQKEKLDKVLQVLCD